MRSQKVFIRIILKIAMVAAILVGATTFHGALAVGAERGKSNFKTTFDLHQDTQLQGTTVRSGSYTLEVGPTETRILLHGKLIVRFNTLWKEGSNKAKYNAVVLRDGNISEFRFEGQSRFLSVQ